MSGDEYIGLIDRYAAATLTGMLNLSAQQDEFTEKDLHQACDTAFTIARIMITKRDAIVTDLSQQK